MWDLAQITILGFPLSSFAALLAAFWVLGFSLTRGGAEWRAARQWPRNLVRLPVPPSRARGAATSDRKMAA